MVRNAQPKWHRLEACATNEQAGSLRYQSFSEQARRLLFLLFYKRQETNYLVKDTIIKEITAFVAPGLLSFLFMKMGRFPLAFPLNLEGISWSIVSVLLEISPFLLYYNSIRRLFRSKGPYLYR